MTPKREAAIWHMVLDLLRYQAKVEHQAFLCWILEDDLYDQGAITLRELVQCRGKLLDALSPHHTLESWVSSQPGYEGTYFTRAPQSQKGIDARMRWVKYLIKQAKERI